MKGGFAAQIVDGKMVEDSNNAESIPNVPNNKFVFEDYFWLETSLSTLSKRFLILGHIYLGIKSVEVWLRVMLRASDESHERNSHLAKISSARCCRATLPLWNSFIRSCDADIESTWWNIQYFAHTLFTPRQSNNVLPHSVEYLIADYYHSNMPLPLAWLHLMVSGITITLSLCCTTDPTWIVVS